MIRSPFAGSENIETITPISADLFETGGEKLQIPASTSVPRLIGGQHKTSGKIVFPLPAGELAKAYEAIPLHRQGTLWSYTIQRFPPKSPPYKGPNDPHDFEPFALGYVELEGQVIVESRLVIDTFARLRIGMAMELTILSFINNETGMPVATYAFQPVEAKISIS